MVCQIEIEGFPSQSLGIDNSKEEFCSFKTTIAADLISQEKDVTDHKTLSDGGTCERSDGATVLQTSVNVGKMCLGTGTLALPFAAEQAGLMGNVIGLGLIGLWNYYAANCLLRCVEFLPQIDAAEAKEGKNAVRESCHENKIFLAEQEQRRAYGTMDSSGDKDKEDPKHDLVQSIGSVLPPPDGTTMYGAVAWYASGPKGLMVLDLLMLSLFFGLFIAYEVAMQGFINDTPLTTGSKGVDLLIPSTIIAIISCAPDMSFLSKFSGMGILAVVLSFVVISWQGFSENGFSGFGSELELNQWPADLSAASSWFGVVVFFYGVVPFVFNFRNSMKNPNQVGASLQIGLSLVYAGAIAMSNGIRVLFSPGRIIFDGDVLKVMPNSWVSLAVRLLMTFVVAVSAPLIVLPFGELVEGKLGIEKAQPSFVRKRIVVRVTFCIICTIIAGSLGPVFVHIVSFIGCFCVSITSFVLPPLFCIQLSNQNRTAGKGQSGIDSLLLCDVVALVIGIMATVVSSTLTFCELVVSADI